MEPVSAAFLTSLAASAGTDAGQRIWAGLTALIRRPMRHRSAESVAESGEQEFVALEQAPQDPARAQSLATALFARAQTDDGFATALQAWLSQSSTVRLEAEVTNTISGGQQSGPVLQGRDFNGIAFGPPSA
jgi:hypothetical protein